MKLKQQKKLMQGLSWFLIAILVMVFIIAFFIEELVWKIVTIFITVFGIFIMFMMMKIMEREKKQLIKKPTLLSIIGSIMGITGAFIWIFIDGYEKIGIPLFIIGLLISYLFNRTKVKKREWVGIGVLLIGILFLLINKTLAIIIMILSMIIFGIDIVKEWLKKK